MNIIILTSFILLANLMLVNSNSCGCGHKNCAVDPNNGCSCSDNDCVIRSARCGSIVYNKDHFVCCNGYLLSSEGGKTWCCGNTNFNPKEGLICCTGVGLMNDQFCYCGGRKYRANAGMCCAGRYYPLIRGSPFKDCCGIRPYDPYRHVCREGNLIEIRNDL